MGKTDGFALVLFGTFEYVSCFTSCFRYWPWTVENRHYYQYLKDSKLHVSYPLGRFRKKTCCKKTC